VGISLTIQTNLGDFFLRTAQSFVVTLFLVVLVNGDDKFQSLPQIAVA